MPLKSLAAQAHTPSQTVAPTPAGAELWQFLRQLYQHKWLASGAVLLACTVAYLWTQRLPRLYQADCTIEYDLNPVKPLGRDTDDSSPAMLYWSSREFFATENKILTSRALAERVVSKLGLNHNAEFLRIPEQQRKTWNGDSVVETAQALQGMINVEQERDTSIVHIRVTHAKPELAMMLANAIADAYIEKTMQDRLGSTSSALEWLSTQLDSLKQQLERSELSLHEFVEDKANLSMPFDDQQKLVSADIQRFSATLSETRLKRIELSARLAALEAVQPQDALVASHPAIAENKAVQSLRAQYYEATAQREQLAVKYGDQHPQIRALDVQLELLRDQLRREIDRLITNARAELNEIQAIESGVQGLLSQSNRAGLELNLQEITYRRLQRERDNSARLYGSILERTADTDLSHALQVSFVRIVDRALKPSYSIYPSFRRNLTVGALVGLMLGVALALLLTQLDRVIRTVEEAESFGITVLGIMPRVEQGSHVAGISYGRRRKRDAPGPLANRDLVVHTHPKSSAAECCRTIRTNLTFMAADRPQRAIVVTSANPQEGKTTVTISLAISLAQSGKRVLLVDTDLRKPRLHKALRLANGKGVTSVLVGEHTTAAAIQQTEIPGLDLLSSGPIPPNPAELLHTAQFRDLVGEVSSRYDHVLFDSPPLAAVTDAAVIAPQVDGVLIVIHGQRTTRDALRSVLRQLRDVSAHLTGAVLNDLDLSARQYGYGSYYYYQRDGYYETPEEPRADAPAAEA